MAHKVWPTHNTYTTLASTKGSLKTYAFAALTSFLQAPQPQFPDSSPKFDPMSWRALRKHAKPDD